MKDFDELLNGVLREDASAQPRPGLEARVMARAQADGQRRPLWRFVTWGAVAAALPVCVVVLLVWPRSVPPMQRVHSVPPAVVSTVSKKADLQPTRNERLKTARARVSVRPESAVIAHVDKSLPKLDVFPSPAPEDMFPRPIKADEGERQLAELRSKKAGEALVALHQEQNQPIQIVAIEITPIQMDGAAGRD